MAPRFVILHHLVEGGEHWDLCLERGDFLLTWQLEREPIDRAALPIRARRIGDHRKDYLEYEGTLSGNRGQVRRVDRGRLEFTEFTATRCVFRLEGDRLSGWFQLTMRGEEWVFEAGP